MQKWILSANPRIYDHEKAFCNQGFIDWNQSRKFSVGDLVYIYCSKPISQVKYLTIVDRVNMSYEEIDDDLCYWRGKYEIKKKYMRLRLIETIDNQQLSLSWLQQHGLRYAPQSPTLIKTDLQVYLDRFFQGVK